MKLLDLEDTKDNRRHALYIGQESPAKVATVTVDGQKIKLPVVPQPGQALGTIAIALGYGRKGTENFTREEWLGDLYDTENSANNTIGKNAFPFHARQIFSASTCLDRFKAPVPQGERLRHHF